MAAARFTVTRALCERVINVIEAAYRFDLDDQTWLAGVVHELSPIVPHHGVMAGMVDYSNLAQLQLGVEARLGVPPGFAEFFLGTLLQCPPEYLRLGLSIPCRTASEVAGWSELPFVTDGSLHGWGVRDALYLAALDGSRRGVITNIFVARETRLTLAARALISRVSSHIATAHRLRRRLAAIGATIEPEAVLSPRGKIEHAVGPAREAEALAALRAAALDMERARGKLRREGERVVDLWRSMVHGRWTLVDRFDHDGKRYILARENEPAEQGPRALSPRERQVVALAALGHSGKLIAYDLGIAYSTVRVVLANARRKLGVASVEDLARVVITLPSADS